MNLSRRQQATVLFGDTLKNNVPAFSAKEGDCIIPGQDAQLALTPDILSNHLMLLGGIGTGKTNAFYHIVSQLRSRLTDNDIMIVFDTKGDFYNEFYRPGDIVISNDNKAAGVNGEDYWNIFNEIAYDSRQQESVIEISKALFAEACKKTNQIFFPNAAKDIFMALLIHFIHSVPEIHRCNENLLKFINRCSATDIKAILNFYDDFKAMSSYISNEDSPQTQGVLSELQQIVREIFIGNFAKNGTLSLKNLIRNKGGKTVFIEYDLSTGNMLSPIYSLLFDLAIKEALGRNRSEGNVYFITDEFKLLPNLQHIDDAVNFGRSLGIKFMVGVQNVEQIYDNYGEERARSIMSGFSTTISFRVNDAKSREYIQSLYGKNQKLESFMPTMQSKGLIEAQREANVVEDWDITRLQVGEAIIGLPGQEPFKFKFKKY